MFIYEHIGHMHFSTLTLRTLDVLCALTDGRTGIFVPLSRVAGDIQDGTFSPRLVASELDRMCYGFECIEERDRSGERHLALTSLGHAFIEHLLSDAAFQAAQLAVLIRPSRRKSHWNLVIQESTYFTPDTYDALRRHGFRSGPARDFLKSLSSDRLDAFLKDALGTLKVASQPPRPVTLRACREEVARTGRVWSAVKGRYAWFVFGQRFEVSLSDDAWGGYCELIKRGVRPPEWRGGCDIPCAELSTLLGSDHRVDTFRNAGVIRPVWKGECCQPSHYRLTAPGYLMWERKTRGVVFEFLLRRMAPDQFLLGLCDASDLPRMSIPGCLSTRADGLLPSLHTHGTANHVLMCMRSVLDPQGRLMWPCDITH